MRDGRWKGEWENARGERRRRTEPRSKDGGTESGAVESVNKEARATNKHESTLACFPFCDNKSPEYCQFHHLVSKHIYPSRLGEELKANLLWELFLGFVLICRIYLQLAFALLIPRVGVEGGVVIQFFKLGYATNSLSRLTITLDAILNGSRGFNNNFNKHTQTCPLDSR